MDTGKKLMGILTWLGVALLQLIGTQVVTFILSLVIPGMENELQTRPVVFILLVGIAFSIGVFLVGWLALRLGWLKGEPRILSRLAGTLIGAYLPLIAALILVHPVEAGNPFFFISELAAILGFHLPGLLNKK